MVTHLRNSQPKLGITDRDIECVQIAGLCHDLGHGPWSHVWDGMFIPRARCVPLLRLYLIAMLTTIHASPNTTWKHEHASEMMFDDLVKQHDIDISDEDRSFIKALIAGEPSKCMSIFSTPALRSLQRNAHKSIAGSPDEKPFLFHIVANKLNGIDVDKSVSSSYVEKHGSRTSLDSITLHAIIIILESAAIIHGFGMLLSLPSPEPVFISGF
jgi:HD superfamily phosphohydrolase